MEVYHQIEANDGVRMSWNVLPNCKQAHSKLVIPTTVCYTPLNDREFVDLGLYQPICCTNCSAVLNPFTKIEQNGSFSCLFCMYKNMIPQQVLASLQGNSLPESHPSYTTNEFTIKQSLPMTLLFVVDLSVLESELNALKQTLLALIQLLPDTTQVGLITFHKHCFLFDLSDTLGLTRCYAFKAKQYTSKDFANILHLNNNKATPNTGNNPLFLSPLSECEFQLSNFIESLKPSPWPTATDLRLETCTGTALNLATCLLEQLVPKTGARILSFLGGPCTIGPGMIVDVPLKLHLRSHHDIDKESTLYFKSATKHYDVLAKRASDNGHVIDLFTGCLDQVGLAEMRSLASMTNGVMVLSDSFNTSIFKQSLLKFFMDANEIGAPSSNLNAVIDVYSSDLKLSGCIGNLQSTGKKGPVVSDVQIGIANTSQYKCGSLTPNSTFCFYFENNNQQPLGKTTGYIQFTTLYQNNGFYKLRVTTIARNFGQSLDGQDSLSSFDQEAATIAMARIAIYKAELDEAADVLRWLDRMLIRTCQRVGDYQKDDPSSFHLNPLFTQYPQFLYHLRRSQFLQVFNNSPDETSFYRHTLNLETVGESIIMIQPTLMRYNYTNPLDPEPVLLDSASVTGDSVLLLDTYFHLLIHRGEQVAQWIKDDLHLQQDYANIKLMIEQPEQDSKEILVDRFPVPRYIICDQNTSQARFLLARLNPSGGYQGQQQQGNQAIFTDDVSMQVFMEHLKKLVVGQQN